MQALIDGDILPWEIGSCAHWTDDDGEEHIRDFEFCQELIDQKIEDIVEDSFATGPPIIFLTADQYMVDASNRKRAKKGLPLMELKPNFREAVAVTKPYKGQRKDKVKPFHFNNIKQYLLATYDCRVANGYEADDLMTVTQYEYKQLGEESIICSRDKDLRIASGWHYGWECGRQPAYGPAENDELGEIHLDDKGQLKGTGLRFFYSQCLMGDPTDNIPGLPRVGPKKAYEILKDCSNEEELYVCAYNAYADKYADEDIQEERMLEQAQLLWMVRELDENGNPAMYVPYYER